MKPQGIQIFVVRKDSPALNALMRIVEGPEIKPGRILPVNDKEFESFKEDFLQIEISND